MMLTLRLWLGASVSVMVLKVDVLLTTLRTGRISEPQSVKFSLLQVTNSPSLMKNIPLTSATNFLVSLSMLRCPSHTTRCLNGYRVRCERPSRLWGRSKKQCIIVRKWTLVLHRTWPSAWFFSRGGQIRESVERKSPACSKGWARARVCGEASNSWWRVLKIMHEYSVYWDFQRDYWLQLTKRMVTVWDLTVRGRSMSVTIDRKFIYDFLLVMYCDLKSISLTANHPPHFILSPDQEITFEFHVKFIS